MRDKIIILVGILLSSILIIENIVATNYLYLFIWKTVAEELIIASLVIGIFVGYSLKGLLNKNTNIDEDNYDF